MTQILPSKRCLFQKIVKICTETLINKFSNLTKSAESNFVVVNYSFVQKEPLFYRRKQGLEVDKVLPNDFDYLETFQMYKLAPLIAAAGPQS